MTILDPNRENFLKLILNNNEAKLFFKNEQTKKLITDFKAAFKNSSSRYSEKLAKSLGDIRSAIDGFDEKKNELFLVKEFNQFFSSLPEKANDMKIVVRQFFKSLIAGLELFAKENNFDNLMKLVPEVMANAKTYVSNIASQVSEVPTLVNENNIIGDISQKIESFGSSFKSNAMNLTKDIGGKLKASVDGFSELLLKIKNLAKQD